MSRNLNNFPCTCGHSSKDHDYINKSHGCWTCSLSGVWLNCEYGFIPDNLKYLEEKYESKNETN